MIIKALTNDTFDWQGEFYQIPQTSIRPRPISHPERRFHASAVSPKSAELMAKLGFGMLIVMQNEWPKAAEDVHRYRAITRSVGHTPKPPIILTNVACAPTPGRGAGWAIALSRGEMGFDRQPLPFLGRASDRGEGLRVPTGNWRRPTPR